LMEDAEQQTDRESGENVDHALIMAQATAASKRRPRLAAPRARSLRTAG
jgi:hypothetical protein